MAYIRHYIAGRILKAQREQHSGVLVRSGLIRGGTHRPQRWRRLYLVQLRAHWCASARHDGRRRPCLPLLQWYRDGMSETLPFPHRGLGERHHSVKYSDELIRTALAMRRSGLSSAEVSAITGISTSQIEKVETGESRAYLSDRR